MDEREIVRHPHIAVAGAEFCPEFSYPLQGELLDRQIVFVELGLHLLVYWLGLDWNEVRGDCF